MFLKKIILFMVIYEKNVFLGNYRIKRASP